LPLLLRQFSIRRGSGGLGLHRGGDGVVREIQFQRPLTVSLITSRRLTQPYGLAGGQSGGSGKQVLKHNDRTIELPPCTTLDVEPGDQLRLETPGGGGWGQA
ncbi:MAG: hydantoinase B/oxoprolinase family protein, partial [Planctomycetota bacterium]